MLEGPPRGDLVRPPAPRFFSLMEDDVGTPGAGADRARGRHFPALFLRKLTCIQTGLLLGEVT